MPGDFTTLMVETSWNAIRQLGFNLRTKAAIGRDMGREVSNNEARTMVVDAIARAERNAQAGEAGIEGTLSITATGQISLLEMAYHIAEIAQVKYNYNARGDDFMFIMAMCQISLDSLRRQVAPAADPLANLIAPPAVAVDLGESFLHKLVHSQAQFSQEQVCLTTMLLEPSL